MLIHVNGSTSIQIVQRAPSVRLTIPVYFALNTKQIYHILRTCTQPNPDHISNYEVVEQCNTNVFILRTQSFEAVLHNAFAARCSALVWNLLWRRGCLSR